MANAVTGEAGSMDVDIKGFRDRGEQPPTGLKQLMYDQSAVMQEGGGQSTEEYGGRTAPKA